MFLSEKVDIFCRICYSYQTDTASRLALLVKGVMLYEEIR